VRPAFCPAAKASPAFVNLIDRRKLRGLDGRVLRWRDGLKPSCPVAGKPEP